MIAKKSKFKLLTVFRFQKEVYTMKLNSKMNQGTPELASWCPCSGACLASCKSSCYGCKGNCADLCTGCSISESYH